MFHLVLFEPEIPPNTGNVIRLCANVGATLHLIKPLGFRLDDKSLQRSGLDYHDLADVRVHSNLDECLGTLAESRVFAVETGGQHCYSDIAYREGDAFLFGPETRGLPAAVQSRIGRERCLFIPMQAASRSINLSNAVALVTFEAWRQMGFRIASGT
jgi:tRNA (cytidine/uridine-2'-O-)-methyltransferase